MFYTKLNKLLFLFCLSAISAHCMEASLTTECEKYKAIATKRDAEQRLTVVSTRNSAIIFSRKCFFTIESMFFSQNSEMLAIIYKDPATSQPRGILSITLLETGKNMCFENATPFQAVEFDPESTVIITVDEDNIMVVTPVDELKSKDNQ